MEKRYQVFVSSTYVDLQTERQQVIQALMEMDCIPAGMELFPAADEEQWEFIKRIIDDCDYYLLIIGGRYGSISPEGISYTEMEYDYAVEKGLKVIALLHDEPEALPAKKVELEKEAQERLSSFREKVGNGRLVKFWSRSDQLAGLVALSLSKTIKMYPAVGWVRADQGSSTELLLQINDLRDKNEALSIENKILKEASVVEEDSDYSSGEETFQIDGTYEISYSNGKRAWNAEATWNQILSLLGPHLFQYLNEKSANIQLAKSLLKAQGKNADGYYSKKTDDEVFQTIKIQLLALGYIDIKSLQTKSSGMAMFWIITEKGKRAVISLRTVKKSNA